MARTTSRSLRKVSGGRYHFSRGKKSYELAGFPANTKLADTKKAQHKRGRGGAVREALLTIKQMNIADKQGKSQKTEIVNVVENPANANLVRRNIITKGCIVETKLGRARVTSRPGQEGCVNGVLV